jgi:hypothetical protein
MIIAAKSNHCDVAGGTARTSANRGESVGPELDIWLRHAPGRHPAS